MAETSRHDAWQAGDSYDLYMGRWSRQVAPRFLDWIGAEDGLDWLEVGCGTGALSAAILTRCEPKSLISIDPSDGFIAKARSNVPDGRVEFQLGEAQALPLETASRDVIVSGLVLNFVPPQAEGARRDEASGACWRNGRILRLGLSRRRHRIHAPSGMRRPCLIPLPAT